MSIESLPKAPLEKFIKNNTNLKIPKESVQLFLFLANQYIISVADKANCLCEQENKVSISVNHLESVLVHECGITSRLGELQEMRMRITLQKKQKREASKLLYERIERMREEDELNKGQSDRKKVIVREKFDELQKAANSGCQLDFNYEQLEQETNKATSKQVIDCDLQ